MTLMNNKIFENIKDKIVFVSDNFKKEKSTCLEYGGLNEVLISFKIKNETIDIMINPCCSYEIDGRVYVDSMVSEEDMGKYLDDNFTCWYMNYFYIIFKDNKFVFHDMNNDSEKFMDFIETVRKPR